jgi:uncharacterized membrane protein
MASPIIKDGNSTISETGTTWHSVVLWFLGGIALLALADPAPGIATGLILLIILGLLLNNWAVYKHYLGLSNVVQEQAQRQP